MRKVLVSVAIASLLSSIAEADDNLFAGLDCLYVHAVNSDPKILTTVTDSDLATEVELVLRRNNIQLVSREIGAATAGCTMISVTVDGMRPRNVAGTELGSVVYTVDISTVDEAILVRQEKKERTPHVVISWTSSVIGLRRDSELRSAIVQTVESLAKKLANAILADKPH